MKKSKESLSKVRKVRTDLFKTLDDLTSGKIDPKEAQRKNRATRKTLARVKRT